MKNSQKLFQRAQRVIPGGVNSPVRAFRSVGGTPPFVQRGKGARVFSASTYVAAKSVNRLRKGGRPDELVDQEVISFQSGEIGRFAMGTVCVATGKLESLPLSLFRKTT